QVLEGAHGRRRLGQNFTCAGLRQKAPEYTRFLGFSDAGACLCRKRSTTLRCTQHSFETSQCPVVPGAATIRCISNITTTNGACRPATLSYFSSFCCWKASRRDCPGSPCCASASATGKCCSASTRSAWHA